MNLQIILQNISVRRQGQTFISGLHWDIGCIENWAVTGPNASGKTTLLRVLSGLTWPDSKSRRLYVLDGQRTTSPLPARAHMRFLGPDTMDVFTRHAPFLSAGKIILGGPADSIYPPLNSQTPDRANQLGMETAEKFGIKNLWTRPWASLSSGQAWRVLLARTWLAAPSLLIWDEFGANLDSATIRAMQRSLDEMAESKHIRLILSTHRQEELPSCIDRLFTLPQGRSMPRVMDRKKPSTPLLTRRRSQKRATTASSPARLENCKVQRLGRIILDIPFWEIRSGEHWMITGPNGAGKSTLLNLVAGRTRPLAPGTIVWFNDPHLKDIMSLNKKIGMFSPEIQNMIPSGASVLDVIASGQTGRLRPPECSRDEKVRAGKTARAYGIQDLLGQPLGTLSFGRRRMVCLLRAFAGDQALLLLDEPFSGLDGEWRKKLQTALQKAADHKTLIVATHHPCSLPDCHWNVLQLVDGKPVF